MPWLNVPHQQQLDTSWCLPACIAMVSAYWQQPLYQADVARWLGTTDIGTPSSRIRRLNRHGFEVIYGEGSLANLSGWLSQDCPLILFLRTGDLPHWSVDTPHALVLAGIENDTAIVFDPGIDDEPRPTPVDHLMLAWSFFDYTYAMLRPET
jgi:ABC-type bacteriocin/lantibiotic exporter with double-glycine peptidase domain